MDTVYQPLSYDTADLSCSRPEVGDESANWVQAFIRREVAGTKGAGLKEWKKPLRPTFPLEPFSTGSVVDSPIDNVVLTRKKQQKSLCAKDKRALNVLSLGKTQRKYADYIALHGLWLGYMEELLVTTRANNKRGPRAASSNQLLNRLMKADLHGAILKVIRAKCPSYVGTEGILILETKHTFVLITLGDAVKVIPKANNVFSIGLSSRGLSFTLYGNHFLERTADRSAKKWKRRDTIDL